MLPNVSDPLMTSTLPAYTVNTVLNPIKPMISGKKSACTRVNFSDCRLYSLLSLEKFLTDSCSRANDLITRIPEKASCTKVLNLDWLF